MKKSWVPLLVIALGVAVLATLVFYGLVVSGLSGVEAKVNHPAPAQDAEDTEALTIPVGLRALSIRVVDSDGLLRIIKPHDRVDIQAVYGPADRLELRTIAQNVEVLAVATGSERAPGRGNVPVVTLATTPADADVVGLADTAARLRLALRNASDHEGAPRPSIGMAAVMNVESSRSTGSGSSAAMGAAPSSPVTTPSHTQNPGPATLPTCKSCVRP